MSQSAAPERQKDTALPRLLILVFNEVTRDARVLRQIKYLSPHFRVTVAGFGENPLRTHSWNNVEWFELDRTGSMHPDYRRRQKRFLSLSTIFPGALTSYFSEEPFWRHALHLAQAARFRVIICNDVETLPIGIAVKRSNRSCKILLDMHEYAPRERGDDDPAWIGERRPLVTRVLKRFARHADAVTTVAESFGPLFRSEFGTKKPVIIHNAPELGPLPSPAPQSDGKIHLVHHGACFRLRKMERMIGVMRLLDARFVLHFMLLNNDPDYLAFLRSEAAGLPAGKVVFHDPVAPAEITRAISRFDAGLYILPPNSFNDEHAMPNKFFDFIAAGLAVAIGPSVNMARITRDAGIGWIAPDYEAASLAEILNRVTPESLASCRAAAVGLRESLNAQSEMAKLVALARKLAGISDPA